MPVITEATTVEVNVSRTDTVQPIVEVSIASNNQQENRTVKTMEIVGIIPNIVAQTTLNHAATTDAVMTTGVMVTMMTAAEPKRSSTARTNGIVRSTSHVSTRTKNSA